MCNTKSLLEPPRLTWPTWGMWQTMSTTRTSDAGSLQELLALTRFIDIRFKPTICCNFCHCYCWPLKVEGGQLKLVFRCPTKTLCSWWKKSKRNMSPSWTRWRGRWRKSLNERFWRKKLSSFLGKQWMSGSGEEAKAVRQRARPGETAERKHNQAAAAEKGAWGGQPISLVFLAYITQYTSLHLTALHTIVT